MYKDGTEQPNGTRRRGKLYNAADAQRVNFSNLGKGATYEGGHWLCQ